jgi:hypothetical protein
MSLRLADRNRMALLEDFMYRNKSFESLHFICKDGLSARFRRKPPPPPTLTTPGRWKITNTFIPAQKAVEDL